MITYIHRYGLDEIRQWHFETWNEPNCGFYTGRIPNIYTYQSKDIDISSFIYHVNQ